MRGRVARIQIKQKATQVIFRVNIRFEMMVDIVKEFRNSTAVKSLIIKMFRYSAIKMRAKVPLLNSTLNPETSSDSPSERSNGVRFVSARVVVNQIINMIKNRVIYGRGLFMNMSVKSIDIIDSRTERRIRDILTS